MPSPTSTKPLQALVLEVLQRYLSNVNAQLVLRRALREGGLSADRLTARDVHGLAPRLENAARLFIEEGKLARLRADTLSLAGGAEPPSAQTFEVRIEVDISRARSAARRMAEALGGTALAVQKIATIVSELARNILDYAGAGRVELHPRPQHRLLIRAVDSGPGIANLEDILAGRYHSRTGLGVGLAGTKRLSERFEIQTGKDGTRVEAEVRL